MADRGDEGVDAGGEDGDRSGTDAGRFEVWTVATFDLVAFSLVLVLAAHVSGALTGALSSLGTLPGLLLFGYLWTLVAVAVGWVLRGGGAGPGGATGRGVLALLLRGVAGGAFAGGALVLGVALVGGAVAAAFTPELVTTVAFVGLVGTPVAAVVGGAVGAAFAAVNVLLFRLGDRVAAGVRADPSEPGSTADE